MGEELKKVNAGRSTAGISPLSEEEFENILDQEEDYVVQERIGILEWFYDRFIGNGYNEDDKDSSITQVDFDDTIAFGSTINDDGTSSTQENINFNLADNDTASGTGESSDLDITNE